MRRAANFLIPVTLITLYYVFWAGIMTLLLIKVPVVREFFPVGGLGDLAGGNSNDLEIIYSDIEMAALAPNGPVRLAFASLGAAILIIPISWVYFITSRNKDVDQSFVQTIIVMPIVVTGIATIVLNSLPLAFALAGVVAAVRFRFTLDQPSHHWSWSGHWRAWCCHGHIHGIRLFHSDHLETAVWQGIVWTILLNAHQARSHRG